MQALQAVVIVLHSHRGACHVDIVAGIAIAAGTRHWQAPHPEIGNLCW